MPEPLQPVGHVLLLLFHKKGMRPSKCSPLPQPSVWPSPLQLTPVHPQPTTCTPVLPRRVLLSNHLAQGQPEWI